MIKRRSSGIELLRIIAMLMIITLHIFNFGKLTYRADEIGGAFNNVTDLIWMFDRCCVNVYIIITGYFLAERNFDLRKTLKRITSTYSVMLFYSVFLFITAILFFPNVMPENFGLPQILKALFPFTSGTWYFLTLYLMLIALSPFINIILQQLEKNQYKVLLGIMFFITSFYPMLSKLAFTELWVNVKRTLDINGGKSLYSFIFMYCIGGYLKRFVKKAERADFRYLAGYMGFCLVGYAFKQLSDQQSQYSKSFGWFSHPLVIFGSVAIFMFFNSLNFESKVINKIASVTFAVYMIHEFTYSRNFIWSVFNFENYEGSVFQCVLEIIGISLLIFTVCMAIELLRQLVWSRISCFINKKVTR